MENIFNQKNVYDLFLSSLGSRVSIYVDNFFFKFILSFQQFDNCSHCLPPVSFTPVANLPPVSLIPVVHLEYLREFSKIFEMVLMEYSGDGTDSWKNQKQKISWDCPFNFFIEF